MEKLRNLEKIMEKISKYDDNLYVDVKISFLMEVLNELGHGIPFNDKLFEMINARYSKMELLKELNKEYISIKVYELKYLLEQTKELDLNRNMFIVTNRRICK